MGGGSNLFRETERHNPKNGNTQLDKSLEIIQLKDICNGLNIFRTGPLACLSLFSVLFVDKGQYFNLLTCYTKCCVGRRSIVDKGVCGFFLSVKFATSLLASLAGG